MSKKPLFGFVNSEAISWEVGKDLKCRLYPNLQKIQRRFRFLLRFQSVNLPTSEKDCSE
jgi:hypothetical protein